MATIHFFGKPGCINNGRQKELLDAAGHTVLDHDITRHEFTPESLRSFFGDMPVAEWFNYTAPSIKNGRVDPSALSEVQALESMLVDRLLIRRPLMQIGTARFCGFDPEQLEKCITLTAVAGHEDVFARHINDDIVTCPNNGKTITCTPTGRET